MWRAVEYVREIIGDTGAEHCYRETRRQIRQAALSGSIKVWGKREIPPQHFGSAEECKEVWSLIPPHYWDDFKLTEMATGPLYEDREHTWPDPYLSKESRNRYWALKVHQRELEAEWPNPRKRREFRRSPSGPHGWMAR